LVETQFTATLRAVGVRVIVLTLALAVAVVVLRMYGRTSWSPSVCAHCARWPILSEARIEAAIRNLMEGVIALRSGRRPSSGEAVTKD
jgi:hypothetical protein